MRNGMERLQKVIAAAGYCSRRKAELLITEGKVQVNGVVTTTLGTTVSPSDVIHIEGQPLQQERKVYYLLNKPRNTVSTSQDDRGRPTVMDFLPEKSGRVYPVGRLDFDTTGALLLTNDGALTNRLTHPSHQIEKVYVATVKGLLQDKQLAPLRTGLTLEDGMTAPAYAQLIKLNEKQGHSIVELVLHEGRNHQVKRMFEAIGYEVLKLHRESFAGLSTKGLYQGQLRTLTSQEVAALKKL